MSSFRDFLPCIHGGLAASCEICTGIKKIPIRFNTADNCWQMYGFIKGRLPVRWKWVTITLAEANKMLMSGDRFVRIEYNPEENILVNW